MIKILIYIFFSLLSSRQSGTQKVKFSSRELDILVFKVNIQKWMDG